MALSAAKLTEFPPHLFSSVSLPLLKHSQRFHFLEPSCSSERSTKLRRTPSRNVNIREKTSSWIKTSTNHRHVSKPYDPKQKPKPEPEEVRTNTTAIDRIVLRLRNLGLGSDDEDEELGLDLELGSSNAGLDSEKNAEYGDEKLGDLLKRDWVRPDMILAEDDEYDDSSDAELLPWERDVSLSNNEEENRVGLKKKAVRAPTLADLTIEDEELRRLRRMGMTLRERVNVPKAGITKEVLEKIHDKWRTCELVRLKFHEELATDMRTAHEIVERRTRGLVTWRSGSVMVVYRGANYEGPFSRTERPDNEDNVLFVPNVSSVDKSVESSDAKSPILETSNPPIEARVKKTMTEEEIEYNRLLDGLGPRFEDWWGTGVLPVDADLLPPTVPGYKTPFRLLPTGMRSRLTNAEMTDFRKLSKSLPCHFALGRNRNHQGLATAIVKLWEKSLLVKIAVKRGIQNTNNKIMAEELKNLTGGVLLMRNKYFIVMYRGKDFLPPTVEAALAEREEVAKQIQAVEEKSRGVLVTASVATETTAQAGTLAEFYEAQARWGTDISAEEREKMKEEAVRAERAKVIRRLEHKLALSQAKKLKAERLLSKIVESWVPVNPSDDQETITDEERAMYRRVGLRMKAYLPLGIRGVFDGVIENMHLHWKHRELVKLISKEKQLSFVEESARLLEYESGGILVAIDRVPKGYALTYYRGKNYRRPISLRPRNLLTKAKALKRRVALQRYEALSQHISELEKNIELIKQEIGDSQDTQNTNLWNSEDGGHRISELIESEDEPSMMYSEVDEDDDDWDEDDDGDDDDSQFSSLEDSDL